MAVALTVILGFVGLIVVSSIWRGFVLSILWGWLIEPTFSLPSLSIPAAIGVSLVVGFLTYQIDSNDSKDKKSAGELLAVTFLVPAIMLFAGWVVKHWM